jgi:prevent-host-death family protein
MRMKRNTKRYSIAEARDQLARVVHEAEKGTFIELTRRREPVAVMMSLQTYQHFRQKNGQFWRKLQDFRSRLQPDQFLRPGDLEELRDLTRGRSVEISK